MAIAANLDRPAARELATGLTATVRALHRGLRLTWGISRTHHEDRMRADFALRLLPVNRTGDGGTPSAAGD